MTAEQRQTKGVARNEATEGLKEPEQSDTDDLHHVDATLMLGLTDWWFDFYIPKDVMVRLGENYLHAKLFRLGCRIDEAPNFTEEYVEAALEEDGAYDAFAYDLEYELVNYLLDEGSIDIWQKPEIYVASKLQKHLPELDIPFPWNESDVPTH